MAVCCPGYAPYGITGGSIGGWPKKGGGGGTGRFDGYPATPGGNGGGGGMFCPPGKGSGE